MSTSIENNITAHKKIMKKYKIDNLYLDKGQKRYEFVKKFKGKKYRYRKQISKIKSEYEFEIFVSDWICFLYEKGADNGLYKEEMKKHEFYIDNNYDFVKQF